ncbi:unnamed protein product [Rotaria magnacalcarata]
MQSWNQFLSANPSFTMDVPNNDITLLRDTLMSLETSTIEISIIVIRSTNKDALFRSSMLALFRVTTNSNKFEH